MSSPGLKQQAGGLARGLGLAARCRGCRCLQETSSCVSGHVLSEVLRLMWLVAGQVWLLVAMSAVRACVPLHSDCSASCAYRAACVLTGHRALHRERMLRLGHMFDGLSLSGVGHSPQQAAGTTAAQD